MIGEHADVGESRERMRRHRLTKLILWTAPIAAYLWWRIFRHSAINVFQVPHVDWLVLTPVLFFALLMLLLGGQFMFSGRSPHVVVRPEQLDVRLADVVGIDVVKDEVVRSLQLFLSHRSFAREMGGRPRRGLLFEGGPGTGKTYTAKALAAEAGVPFLFATATSFQSSFQGATSRKVRQFFRALRKSARKHGGAVGFIDEFDAIGLARHGTAMTAAPATASLLGCGGLEGLPMTTLPAATTSSSPFTGGNDLQTAVNELLVQMQSFDEPTGTEKVLGKLADALNLLLPPNRQLRGPAGKPANILLIASTNRADSLDPALLRP